MRAMHLLFLLPLAFLLFGAREQKPNPRITFFPAKLNDGVVNVPDWSEMKKQFGGAQ